MAVQFLLFVMTILLLLIFWELTKINSRLKKAFPSAVLAKDSEKREP